jgi:hypothetical protein
MALVKFEKIDGDGQDMSRYVNPYLVEAVHPAYGSGGNLVGSQIFSSNSNIETDKMPEEAAQMLEYGLMNDRGTADIIRFKAALIKIAALADSSGAPKKQLQRVIEIAEVELTKKPWQGETDDN